MTRASDLAKTAEIIDTASYTFRNKIINGAMEIDQRNAGAEISPAVGSVYYLDRWMAISTAAGKFKIKQNGGSIIPPPGFINYLGITSLSAYTAGASEAFGIRQIIEGFNCADLAWGTANARPITISFWVQSSLTGTFGLGLGNNGFTRAYPASYTISSANTWEYKTITVPGDTTGTWLTSNNIGLYLTWQFGYGSSLSGTANAWNAGTAFAPTGAVSVVGTNGATFYLTGVQVEVGSVATPFERRSYTTELALCQRYYIQWTGDSSATGFPMLGTGYCASTTQAILMIPLPVSMRANATVSFSGTISITDGGGGALTSVSITYKTSASSIWILANASALTTGRGCVIYVQNASTNYFVVSAELL